MTPQPSEQPRHQHRWRRLRGETYIGQPLYVCECGARTVNP